jgi:hemolysin III
MSTIEPSAPQTPRKCREYSAAERIADGSVHVVGVVASLVAATALMIAASRLPAASIASLAVYGFGLIAVFACSAAYHLTTQGRLKALLRRFDHAAIYVKIAGTYTPFAVMMGNAAGLALLAAVWAITAFGATAKLLWPQRLVRTSYVLYLAQGWAIVAAFGPFASAVSARTLLLLLVVGGLTYTVGVVFHLWERLPYHNAIWHALVVAASACHFAAIVDAVALAGA